MSAKKSSPKDKSQIFAEYISTAIAVICAAVFFVCFLTDFTNVLLGGLCILTSLFCLSMYLYYLPRLHEERARKKRRESGNKLYSRLEAALIFSAGASFINNLKPDVIDLGRLCLMALIPFAAIAAVILIRFRQTGKITPLLILPIITALFISFCTMNTINCLPSPVAVEYHTDTIIDKDTSGSRAGSSYHLDLGFDGEKEKLSTSLMHYNSVSVGDTIDISVNTGLLGIQYIEFED